MVRDALVVSAWWYREHATIDDAGDADDAGRHDDAASADYTGGFDATSASGGHVFCLTATIDKARVLGAARWSIPRPGRER